MINDTLCLLVQLTLCRCFMCVVKNYIISLINGLKDKEVFVRSIVQFMQLITKLFTLCLFPQI